MRRGGAGARAARCSARRRSPGAALGYDTVPVRPHAYGGRSVTGNELLDSGPPAFGRVRDAIADAARAHRVGRRPVTGTTSLADSATVLAEALRASEAS